MEEFADSFVDAYRLGLAECKDKIAQAFLELDLSNIVDIEPKEWEEDGDEVADVEGADLVGIEEVTVKVAIVEATANVEEVIIKATIGAPKADSTRVTEGLATGLEE